MTEYIIETGPTNRLVIDRWDAPSGRSLIALTPQHQDARGNWRLAHSCVSIPPAEAQAAAAAILKVAAHIGGYPRTDRR